MSPAEPDPPVRERVVEVFAAAESGSREGSLSSGYLLGETLVLTAGHVVAGGSGGCRVRPLGNADWLDASVVWRGRDCDAALLELAVPLGEKLTPVRLGRIAGDEAHPCLGVGFPRAQATLLARGRARRDTEPLRGHVDPLSGIKEGLLAVNLDGPTPLPVEEGSPLEGCSGAAVFSGPLLVGVAVLHPARWGPDRVKLTPTTLIVADEEARRLLAQAGGPAPPVDAVEDEAARRLLRPPYRRLEPDSPPSFLLRAVYEAVRFRSRPEFEELRAWCAGDDALAVVLLTGRGGSGKTRLGAELSKTLDGQGWVTGFLGDGISPLELSAFGKAVSPLLIVVDYAETRADDAIALITALARSPRRPPSRVLLLAREEGDWWPQLPQRANDPEIELLLAGRVCAAPMRSSQR